MGKELARITVTFLPKGTRINMDDDCWIEHYTPDFLKNPDQINCELETEEIELKKSKNMVGQDMDDHATHILLEDAIGYRVDPMESTGVNINISVVDEEKRNLCSMADFYDGLVYEFAKIAKRHLDSYNEIQTKKHFMDRTENPPMIKGTMSVSFYGVFSSYVHYDAWNGDYDVDFDFVGEHTI